MAIAGTTSINQKVNILQVYANFVAVRYSRFDRIYLLIQFGWYELNQLGNSFTLTYSKISFSLEKLYLTHTIYDFPF